MTLDLSKIHIASSVKYRATFLSGGIVHAFFLAYFIMIGQQLMASINVLSVTLYVVGSIISIPKGSDRIRFGWIIAFYAEIMLHAVIASVLMGWDSDFHLYAIAVLPIAAYLLFLTSSISRFIWTMTAMVVCNVVLMSGTMAYLGIFGSIDHVRDDYIEMIAYINSVYAGIIILVFSFLFVLEISTMLSQLEAANRRLEFIATHDALTGLFNRHSLRKLFKELGESNEPFCIVMGDIDDFKKVNDTYGHDCGDVVLKSVAEIISGGINENDTACRWGGEEMLIVLRGERESCLKTVSEIRERINALEIYSQDKQVRVSMTFGLADCTEGDSEHEGVSGIEQLISVADSKLYEGKHSGKNVIVA